LEEHICKPTKLYLLWRTIFKQFHFQKAFEKILKQKQKLFFTYICLRYQYHPSLESVLTQIPPNRNEKLKKVNSVHCWELQYSRNYRGSRRSKRSSTTAVRHTQATHNGVKFFLKDHVHFHKAELLQLNFIHLFASEFLLMKKLEKSKNLSPLLWYQFQELNTRSS